MGVTARGLGAGDLPAWETVAGEQAPTGTPYAAVSQHTRALAAAFAAEGAPVLVAVDATGVGAAVVEELRRDPGPAEVLGVTAHAGARVSGVWPDLGVPKGALVGEFNQAARGERFVVDPMLPAAGVLRVQLKAYVEKRAASGRVRFEAARERDHDDMVSAAQLAVYAGAYWWEICRQRVPGRG
ncbi:hypothetical protein AB0O47_39470 [Streptomyces noursei]|uniref:hypothetical protein n=1 Tax=Streptomyces noursei TaxID=1971 RepID=UPI00344F1F22